MPRYYSAAFENVAVTAAQDFFEVLPGVSKPVRIAGLMLGQFSDLADAAEEILRVTIFRVTGVSASATSGSGGTTPTIYTIDGSGAAAGCVVEANNTTVAVLGTGGALQRILSYPFNIRTGLELFLPPELRPQVSRTTDATPLSQFLVVRLEAAPTDSLSMSGTIFLEEEN